MPRVYKRKGGKNQWTDDQLKKAMKKVRDKEMSLRAAANTYGKVNGGNFGHVGNFGHSLGN